MEQRDFSFNRESFMEMLCSIRDASKDNEVIYLFLDRAGYHRGSNIREKFTELNIIPIYNVPYKYVNNPVERYWSVVKTHFRALLLDKMLKCPTSREFPMKEALKETF